MVIPEKTDRFVVSVDLIADMTVINPFDFFVEPEAETFPFAYAPQLKSDLLPYLQPEVPGELLAEWMADVPREAPNTVDFLVALNQRLQSQIGYIVRMEPGIQTPEETLGIGKGSCRDTGWLLV